MTTQQLGKGRRITGQERPTLGAQLARHYETGASIRALAEVPGRSYGFVHRLLSESGVSLRSRGGGRPGVQRRATTGTRAG